MSNKTKTLNNQLCLVLSIVIILELVVFIGIGLVVSWLTKKPFSTIVIESIPEFLVFLVIGSIFLLFLFKTSKSNRPNKELAQLENNFKKQLKKSIRKEFGRATYLLINPDLNQIDSQESDVIKNMLSEIPQNKRELRYLLYSTLGLFALKNENLKTAISNFKTASEFNPTSIICLAWLAETYELLGDSINAIEVYNKAADQSKKINSSLFDYFYEQINIVNNNGPRKMPPITGIRYATF